MTCIVYSCYIDICYQQGTGSCEDILVTAACLALNVTNRPVPPACSDRVAPYTVSTCRITSAVIE